MKLHILAALLTLLLSCAFVASPLFADGVIAVAPPDIRTPPVDDPPPPMPGIGVGTPVPVPRPVTPVPVRPSVTVRYLRVEVNIGDQVAVTKADQVFVNDSNRILEGTYVFPLPEDASISSFAMYIDGQKTEGKLLTREEARRIYEETVSRQRDPALLEYLGRGAFQARVFPIPAKGERRIQLEYTQVLGRDGDLVRYMYPLTGAKMMAETMQQVSIHVTINGRQAIKAVYSPSHDIVVTRRGENTVEASYEASNVRPDRDFVLYHSLAAGDVQASLLTYRRSGEDGYFLLLVTPRTEVEAARVVARDVILVLDTSGSMQGDKISQAKEAARFVVDRLNPDDRFALIAFNTTVNRFGEGLMTMQDRDAARRFIAGLAAAGSTNINQALLEALKGVDNERPTVIIFLTDGLPTVGVTDSGQIIANVDKAAPPSVRLFTFGVGYDVNTHLLDTLAANHRGSSAYVKPGENLEDAISGFYAKISTPILTDVSLDFGGVRTSDVYPDPLPDLFAGSQLVLVGRYRTTGTTAITLRGVINERNQQFTYSNLSFPVQTGSDTAFIARLWATRRVGYLLTQIRLHGTDKELVDEIVSLSTRYGIVTPYTSFLVDERQDVLTSSGQQKAGESLGRALAAPAPTAGAAAVQDSQVLRNLREAPSGSAAMQPAQVRMAADKTFLLRNGVWVDTQYQEGMPVITISFASADYFALLSARPEWGKYFAIGEKVTVVLDGTAYRVVDADVAAPPASPSPDEAQERTVTPRPVDNLGFLARIWQWVTRLFGR